MYIRIALVCLVAGSLGRNIVSGQTAAKNTRSNQSAATTNGQSGAPANSTSGAKPDTGARELLKVTIGSSRTSVTRDGSYGIFADLENVSSDVVTISPGETMLVVQPEVSQPNACVQAEIGIFPAQPKSSAQPAATEIHIQPSDNANCPQSGMRDFLGFVPGDYAFTVEGIAYAATAAGQPPMAHTYTETTTLRVSISQLWTAVAAFLGALFAYLVVALQPGHDFDRWRPELTVVGRAKVAGVLIRNAFSAGLLGSAVTIVASRLSDTQFPVKVSVNDFWGALTIGFVAYFIGNKFITTIASRLATPPPANNPR